MDHLTLSTILHALFQIPTLPQRICATESNLGHLVATWRCPSSHQTPIYYLPPPFPHPLGSLRCRSCSFCMVYRTEEPGYEYTRLSRTMDVDFKEREHVTQVPDAGLRGFVVPPGRTGDEYGYFCLDCGLTWWTKTRREWWGTREKLVVVDGWRERMQCKCGRKVFEWGKFKLFELEGVNMQDGDAS